MGVTWNDGRLAAKKLHEALRFVGLDPQRQLYVNLWRDAEGWEMRPEALALIRKHMLRGAVVVGLGQRVQKALAAEGVKHLPMVHPAARGKIRGRYAYIQHVEVALGRNEVAA